MRLSASYVVRRLFVFVLTIWAAASLNFLILRLAPGDPVGAILSRMSQQGASVSGSDQIIHRYRKLFGLDETLLVQYGRYLRSLLHFDLGVSLSNFPTPVTDIIGRALPWTIGLLLAATFISFVVGNLLGALLVWRATPRAAKLFLPPMMIVAAVPYYLLAILLVYILGFRISAFPVSGTERVGATEAFGLHKTLDIAYHSMLPASSIVLSAVGGWMLGMRAMMVGVLDADYLTLAEAKGLKQRRIFVRYAMRNAILPQVTGLALSLGLILSGAVLVEVIFSYPGVGYLLYQAIQNADYTLIQGITFILVLAVAVATLVLDLAYPLLDPRISYRRR
jgi:peptide/nickel transport system permease protein